MRVYISLERILLITLFLVAGTSLRILRVANQQSRYVCSDTQYRSYGTTSYSLYSASSSSYNHDDKSQQQQQRQQQQQQQQQELNAPQSLFELASTPFSVTGVHCDDEGCSIPHMWYELNNCTSIAFAGPSSHQVLLKWGSHPRRILLLSKPDPETQLAQRQAMQILLKRGVVVIVEKSV